MQESGKVRMQRIIMVGACLLALSACQKARELRSEWGARAGLMAAEPKEGRMIEGSAYYQFPEMTPGRHYDRAESSFCYKMQTDILCYDQPRSGWEDRMVGYQEPKRPAVQARPYAANAPAFTPTAAPAGQVTQQPLEPLPQVTLAE